MHADFRPLYAFLVFRKRGRDAFLCKNKNVASCAPESHTRAANSTVATSVSGMLVIFMSRISPHCVVKLVWRTSFLNGVRTSLKSALSFSSLVPTGKSATKTVQFSRSLRVNKSMSNFLPPALQTYLFSGTSRDSNRDNQSR